MGRVFVAERSRGTGERRHKDHKDALKALGPLLRAVSWRSAKQQTHRGSIQRGFPVFHELKPIQRGPHGPRPRARQRTLLLGSGRIYVSWHGSGAALDLSRLVPRENGRLGPSEGGRLQAHQWVLPRSTSFHELEGLSLSSVVHPGLAVRLRGATQPSYLGGL